MPHERIFSLLKLLIISTKINTIWTTTTTTFVSKTCSAVPNNFFFFVLRSLWHVYKTLFFTQIKTLKYHFSYKQALTQKLKRGKNCFDDFNFHTCMSSLWYTDTHTNIIRCCCNPFYNAAVQKVLCRQCLSSIDNIFYRVLFFSFNSCQVI